MNNTVCNGTSKLVSFGIGIVVGILVLVFVIDK
jgi:hypothetical protein